MKILMVCLGNICRSPLAEGILRSKVTSKGLMWEVDSAGTGAWHIGNPPDPRSLSVATTHGIDINEQRARQFSADDFHDFDLILPMDQGNYDNIIRMAETEEQKQKVKKILTFTDDQNNNVPDPYYNDNGFENVYQLLDNACNQMIKKLSDE